jgi:hypothetical protein
VFNRLFVRSDALKRQPSAPLADERRHSLVRTGVRMESSLGFRRVRGFHPACEDLKPARRFPVNLGPGRETIGLRQLAAIPAAL